MTKWKEHLANFGDPILRFEKYLIGQGLITESRQEELRKDARNDARNSLKKAMVEKMPSIDKLFSAVYENVPKPLEDQKEELRNHIRKYPEYYNLAGFKDGESWIK